MMMMIDVREFIVDLFFILLLLFRIENIDKSKEKNQ